MVASELNQFIVISLNSKKYGINVQNIDSIIFKQNITRVPGAQSYFLGVINLRGEVVPVMSLKSRLGLSDDGEHSSKARIIIVKPEVQPTSLGLLVDQVNEAMTLDSSKIEKMSHDENDEKAKFNAGIGKVDNDLIDLLDITAISRT